ESLDSHRGQVSFPGGVIEDKDNGPVEAALRELEEEIGISADEVEILGCIDNMFTVTQFSITPVVGKISWPINLHLNKSEVARAFGVPISWLADKNNIKTEERTVPGLDLKVPVYFFKPFEGEVIWGATARITLNFLEIIGIK
ncbi:MAG: CoA pyrophosphatase, partial [Anaerolineales bacterium]